MEIKHPKYNYGDKVWIIKTVGGHVECPLCKGNGYIGTHLCKSCNDGEVYMYKYIPWERTIDTVRINLSMDKDGNSCTKFYYLENGCGSWEEVLYATKEEAEVEANSLNEEKETEIVEKIKRLKERNKEMNGGSK